MRFEEALKAMREGKRVTRPISDEWKVIYWFSRNAIYLQVIDIDIINKTEKLYNTGETTFDYSDINSEDWEVINDR